MKKKAYKRLWIVSLFGVILFNACKNAPATTETVNSWEQGQAVIPADENLQDILAQFSDAFVNEFPKTEIGFDYQSNDSLVSKFVAGHIHSMIITRLLTDNESEFSTMAQKIRINQQVFAYSGIALIANNAFADSVIDLDQLNTILAGNSVAIVFDNAQSGIAKYVMQKLFLDPALVKNAKSAGNVESVIKYVEGNKDAIGFIPFSYISDPDRKSVQEILNRTRLLDVEWNDTVRSISQESIALDEYPLRVPLNMVLGGQYEPVVDGFKSYLFKERAAKILLKAGLVPVNIPARNYNLQEEIPVAKE
jgi:phosphate transport system substrate-binding protein